MAAKFVYGDVFYIGDWRFERVSAAYIDVYAPTNHRTPIDVINCWDYEKGTTLVRTMADNRMAARMYLGDMTERDKQTFCRHALTYL